MWVPQNVHTRPLEDLELIISYNIIYKIYKDICKGLFF